MLYGPLQGIGINNFQVFLKAGFGFGAGMHALAEPAFDTAVQGNNEFVFGFVVME